MSDETNRQTPAAESGETSSQPQKANNGNDRPAKPASHRPKSKGNQKPNKRSGKNNNQRRTTSNGPRRVTGGIHLRSTSGQSARNWWAQRWIRSMENVVDVNRLRRGRYYAQQGQVLSIEEGDAEMIARVQGSRSKPYTVRISLKAFTDEEWDILLSVLAGKAIFAAELLSGQMPNNIEDAFSEANVSLFPSRVGDLLTDCTCPDWANPCKHVAATHYILGDRFDDDPFLLFRLRGRTQEEIIEGLRLHRLGKTIPKKTTLPKINPLDEISEEDLPPEQQSLTIDNETMGQFWRNEDELIDFEIHVATPEIQLPIFRRLGEPDAAGHYSLEELLGNSYMAVSQAAQIIAFMGGEMDEDEED